MFHFFFFLKLSKNLATKQSILDCVTLDLDKKNMSIFLEVNNTIYFAFNFSAYHFYLPMLRYYYTKIIGY